MKKKIKGETLQEVLKNNKEDDIARIIKEIIRKINKQKVIDCSPRQRVEPLGWESVTNIYI